MNLSTMVADVRDRLSEREENFWSDTHIKAALNEGQNRFCHAEEWYWLISKQPNINVPQGSSEVELIDGVDISRHFALTLRPVTGTQRLILPRRTTPYNGLRLLQQNSGTGEPRWWYVTRTVYNSYEDGTVEAANIITLVPSADQSYVAEYLFFRQPDTLVNDLDKSIVPEQYQGAIVAWATAQMWLKELNASAKAQEQFNIYNTILEQAKDKQQQVASDEVISWGSDEQDPFAYPGDPWDRWRRGHLPANVGA